MKTISQPRIDEVSPYFGPQTWTNPASQGTLRCKTKGWPKHVPKGWEYDGAYHDRMRQWDRDKYKEAQAAAGFKGDSLPRDATDKQLLALCRTYFEGREIKAVRVIYFYNVSSGYDCCLIEYIGRDRSSS